MNEKKTKWKEENNALIRHFFFHDFKEAWTFLSKVALVAEEMNHHPKIENNYNKVLLVLSTHDAGGIVTKKDRELAKRIDALL